MGREEAIDAIWDGPDPATGPRVTVGTLIKAAQDGGADFAEFRREASVAEARAAKQAWEGVPPTPIDEMPTRMSEEEALKIIGSTIFYATTWGLNDAYGYIVERNGRRAVLRKRRQEVLDMLEHIRVEVRDRKGNTRLRPAGR